MRVLVVAAHPDDEALGCGGTAARHAAEGAEVNFLIVAEGVTSRDMTRDAVMRTEELDALRAAATKATAILGAAQPPVFAGLPDQRLDTVPFLDVVKHIERMLDATQPDLVYTHHGGDLNADHRIVHQAVLTAARPLPGSVAAAVCGWETLSSTEWASPGTGPTFSPQRFVELSAEQMQLKLEALHCYDTEMRPFPHARSYEAVEALARLRGAQSGRALAEAFTVVRQIV